MLSWSIWVIWSHHRPAKYGENDVSKLFRHVDPQYVCQFKPEAEGFHGSKALWESVVGYEMYWSALEGFLGDALFFRKNNPYF